MAIDSLWLVEANEDSIRKLMIDKIEAFARIVKAILDLEERGLLNLNKNLIYRYLDEMNDIHGDMCKLSVYISKDKLINMRVKWIDDSYQLVSFMGVSPIFFQFMNEVKRKLV